MEHENYGDTNFNRSPRYSHQRISTGTGGLRNKTSRDHSNYSIVEISQNTEKRLEETRCHSNSSEKPSGNAGVKNSQKSKIIIKIQARRQDLVIVNIQKVK